jgi:hypothetical protein
MLGGRSILREGKLASFEKVESAGGPRKHGGVDRQPFEVFALNRHVRLRPTESFTTENVPNQKVRFGSVTIEQNGYAARLWYRRGCNTL